MKNRKEKNIFYKELKNGVVSVAFLKGWCKT